MNKSDYADKSKRFQGLIKKYKASILAIDKKIDKLIPNDVILSEQHKLLCSIDGVGTKVATMAIVETNAFQNFDDGRSFACHAGVAPFEHTSGSSIRSRHKVSHKANKSIKALLHMGQQQDEIIELKSKNYPRRLRRVAVWNEENKTVIEFIRINIFVKIDLQTWLDNPFMKQNESPPIYTQGVIFIK
jgi:transposase